METLKLVLDILVAVFLGNVFVIILFENPQEANTRLSNLMKKRLGK